MLAKYSDYLKIEYEKRNLPIDNFNFLLVDMYFDNNMNYFSDIQLIFKDGLCTEGYIRYNSTIDTIKNILDYNIELKSELLKNFEMDKLTLDLNNGSVGISHVFEDVKYRVQCTKLPDKNNIENIYLFVIRLLKLSKNDFLVNQKYRKEYWLAETLKEKLKINPDINNSFVLNKI